ncbi:MAG: response regulator [Myxococcota bacterium]
MRVLVVEDNPDDQYLALRALRRNVEGVQVEVAADGLDALQAIARSPVTFDFILLDINMPRMSGLEFLATFGTGNDSPPPVVVMLTSSDQQSDRDEASRYPVVRGFCLKPVNRRVLESIGSLVDMTS